MQDQNNNRSTNNPDQFRGIWMDAKILASTAFSPMEKIILCRIYGLQTEDRGCYASNARLAKDVGSTSKYVSKMINSLIKKRYLHANYKYKESGEVSERNLFTNVSPQEFLTVDRLVQSTEAKSEEGVSSKKGGGVLHKGRGYPLKDEGGTVKQGRGYPLKDEESIRDRVIDIENRFERDTRARAHEEGKEKLWLRDFISMRESLLGQASANESLAMQLSRKKKKCTLKDVHDLIVAFIENLQAKDDGEKNRKDLRSHFANWARIQWDKDEWPLEKSSENKHSESDQELINRGHGNVVDLDANYDELKKKFYGDEAS